MAIQERVSRLNDLIEVIVFFRDHPDVPLPYNWQLDLINCHMPPESTKEDYVALARKNGFKYKGADSYLFSLTRKMGNLTLALCIPKEKTCTRIVTGEILVPAYISPEHLEEQYEWKCDSLLEKIIEEAPGQ